MYMPEDYRVEGEQEYDVDACEYWGHPWSKYEFAIARGFSLTTGKWGIMSFYLLLGSFI